MADPATKDLVLTVACASRRGIVAAVAGFLAEHGCNITDSAQFDDLANGRFFMRVSFRSETGAAAEALREAFVPVAEGFGMDWAIHDPARRMRVLLMVSGFGHCLNDILYRWRIGALPIDIVGVVSNHLTYQKLVVNHDLPFHHIPVTKARKAEAEMRVAVLDAEAEGERNRARMDAEAGMMLGAYLNGWKNRKTAAEGALTTLAAEEEGAREALTGAFEELKKFEHVAEATRLDRLVALAKRETAAFDEQALRRRAV